MDKKPHIKPYLYGMLAGFGAISLSIIFFFFIYRFEGFGDAVSKLTSILMPFIYGAVIAYLLKPVCNTVENFLHRLFPEKMKGLVSALSVAATLLFGLLVIYALFMMIIPQLVTSVTTLYYTARANLSNFIRWVNNLEFVADNEVIMDYVNKAYNAISVDLDSWIKNTLMPSMQNIVSGVGIGVLNVVTVFKNLIIGIIVAIYLLASRKKFAQQAKLILYSILKPALSMARSWTPPSSACCATSSVPSSSSPARCWCRSSSVSPTSSRSSGRSSVPCPPPCSF